MTYSDTYSDTKTAFDKALAAYKRAAQREFAATVVSESLYFSVVLQGGEFYLSWCGDPSKAEKILADYSTRTGRFLFSKNEIGKLWTRLFNKG